MKKNLLLLLTLFVTVFLVLSGCGYGGSKDSKNEGNSGKNSTEGNSVNEDGRFDPPIEITTARPVGSDYTFINGETIHDNVHNTWAEEELGIIINDVWETADNEAYHTQLRLSLTSSDPLPDAFIVQDTILIDDLIQSGRVMDIKEAFDKYASERLKELYEENSDVLTQVTRDDQLMGLPIFTDGDGTSPVLWIRQDWLDNLELDAPTTIEEFETVMEAFTNDDPNGNGKDDTFGFSFSAREGFNNWMSDAGFIFGAFTGKFLPGAYQEAEDGTLKYGSVQPGMKDGLEKLSEWYSQGYLDKELAILDATKATEAFIQGKSGMIAGPAWMAGWPLGDVTSVDPDAELVAYKLPVGSDGESARFMNSLNEGKVMLFSEEFEHMDAFFQYFDKIYDYAFETGDFEDGFFEGYDYAKVDGELIFDPSEFPTPLKDGASSGKYTLFWNEPRIPYKVSEDAHYIYEGNEPETRSHLKASQDTEEIIRAGSINFQMRDINEADVYDGPPTETMKSKGENLSTMELERFSKIIYGDLPIDAFDTFVDEYYEKGGKEIEKEINEWYETVK